jgi:hypothetical protein
LVACEQRIKAIDRIAPVDITQSVDRCGDVVDELAVTCGFKVENTNDFVFAKEKVIRKEITMNDPLWQAVFLVLLLVQHFVIEHMRQMAQVAGKTLFNFLIEREDVSRAKAIVVVSWITGTQGVQGRKRLSDVFQLDVGELCF